VTAVGNNVMAPGLVARGGPRSRGYHRAMSELYCGSLRSRGYHRAMSELYCGSLHGVAAATGALGAAVAAREAPRS